MKDNKDTTSHLRICIQHMDALLHKGVPDASPLQVYVGGAYTTMQRYAESIVLLCEHGRFDAAATLLRSLVETHINVAYQLMVGSERSMAIVARDRCGKTKKIFSDALRFIEKYPTEKRSDKEHLFNKVYIQQVLDAAADSEAALVARHALTVTDVDVSLFEKAQKCDEVSGGTTRHYEHMYHVLYAQLPHAVHLDIAGLESFVMNTVTEICDEDMLMRYTCSVIKASVCTLCTYVVHCDVPEDLCTEGALHR